METENSAVKRNMCLCERGGVKLFPAIVIKENFCSLYIISRQNFSNNFGGGCKPGPRANVAGKLRLPGSIHLIRLFNNHMKLLRAIFISRALFSVMMAKEMMLY